MAQSAEVLLPTSEHEAVDAFGDGSGITVVGGGTIVVPDMTYGRHRPQKALVLRDAGLAGIRRDGGRVVIGAMTRVADLVDGPEPLASAARGVADREVRNAATVGGNLCAGEGNDAPRGDLQAPLIALGAQVRSAGAGGERTEAVEDFLAGSPADRLVLSIEFAEAARTGYARYDRPHAHTYTILAVSATAGAGGLDDLRIAVSGVGPHAVRLAAAEEAARGGGDYAAALADVQPRDDALASGWYRARILPTLVARAVASLA
jgi:CO/xanthine dehydrogenase FAD-binding subunit